MLGRGAEKLVVAGQRHHTHTHTLFSDNTEAAAQAKWNCPVKTERLMAPVKGLYPDAARVASL